MNPEHLSRWQQEALAYHLFKLEHHRLAWQRLAPIVKLSPKARGVFDPEAGAFDTRRALAAPKAEQPGYLTVYVQPLLELGIPAHTLSLLRGDLQEALGTLSENEREAYFEHTGKPRYSALYAVKRVRRRLEPLVIDGVKILRAPNVHHYLYPGENASAPALSAFAKLITFCEGPTSPERLKRLQSGDETATDVEELAAVSGVAA